MFLFSVPRPPSRASIRSANEATNPFCMWALSRSTALFFFRWILWVFAIFFFRAVATAASSRAAQISKELFQIFRRQQHRWQFGLAVSVRNWLMIGAFALVLNYFRLFVTFFLFFFFSMTLFSMWHWQESPFLSFFFLLLLSSLNLFKCIVYVFFFFHTDTQDNNVSGLCVRGTKDERNKKSCVGAVFQCNFQCDFVASSLTRLSFT